MRGGREAVSSSDEEDEEDEDEEDDEEEAGANIAKMEEGSLLLDRYAGSFLARSGNCLHTMSTNGEGKIEEGG